ncbi:reverse transcriptase domain-containing protein [Natranaerobius trueperi]|uniref:reverse transcriptase domain-containing protein n=1 Tax=Natranaerobius trueperi TaxID=759412 RepID=UPI00197B452A|nr:reverse transcriptase domain-containing protein [Natranaerobius trueperi]
MKTGYPYEGMVEPESTKGARSTNSLEPSEEDGAESLLDKLLHTGNLNSAYKRVKQNRGAAGVDGMTVDELMPYLKENKDEFLESLRSGKYKPHPVRRVEIPKPDGGVRLLGVPTVVDRMVQQALVQILQPIFEPTFSDNSFGFRPNRNAQQAIKRSKDYYAQGYKYAVDIDLAKYFDTVNHDLLIGMVREQVKDETIIRLIRKFLKSGAMSNLR